MVKKRNFRQNEVNPQETGAIPFFCLSGLSFPFVKDDWSIYPGGRALEVHSNCTIANPIPGQMAWARNVPNLVWIGSRGKRVRLLHCPESHCCYHLPPLRQSGSGTSKLDAFLFLSIPSEGRVSSLDHWLGLRSRSPWLILKGEPERIVGFIRFLL